MRVLLPELLEARGLTAYMLAARSQLRISESTAHRLVEMRGELQTFGADILSALLDVPEVTPNQLFGWEPLPAAESSHAATSPKPRRTKTAAARRRTR